MHVMGRTSSLLPAMLATLLSFAFAEEDRLSYLLNIETPIADTDLSPSYAVP